MGLDKCLLNLFVGERLCPYTSVYETQKKVSYIGPSLGKTLRLQVRFHQSLYVLYIEADRCSGPCWMIKQNSPSNFTTSTTPDRRFVYLTFVLPSPPSCQMYLLSTLTRIRVCMHINNRYLVVSRKFCPKAQVIRKTVTRTIINLFLLPWPIHRKIQFYC